MYLSEAGIEGGVEAALLSEDEGTRTKARGAKYAHLTDRLGFTFQRAVHATAVTSGTTVAAFLATAISPLLPIGTFGIFAGECTCSSLISTFVPCINRTCHICSHFDFCGLGAEHDAAASPCGILVHAIAAL